MTGYKVSTKTTNGRTVDCFTGYLKTREDAEKYAKWIGDSAKIVECEKKKISTYAIYDENNKFSHLKYN